MQDDAEDEDDDDDDEKGVAAKLVVSLMWSLHICVRVPYVRFSFYII